MFSFIDAAEILEPSGNVIENFTERGNIVLRCIGVGHPPPLVQWRKLNGSLSDRVSITNMSLSTNEGNVTRVTVDLIITGALREDTGVYECLVSNHLNTVTGNISAIVQCTYMYKILRILYFVSPVIPGITSLVSDKVIQKRINTFVCQAVGEPVPYVSWYFNGVMINVSDSKYMIVSRSLNITTTENTLTLYNVASSDVGVYTCNATNIIGSDASNGEKYHILVCNTHLKLPAFIFGLQSFFDAMVYT